MQQSLSAELEKLLTAKCKTRKLVYQCRLETPMFGGGVEAQVIDQNMPFRASAIRGQLRFWWRLLAGPNPPDTQDLFQRERRIWGGQGKGDEITASKVRVRVFNLEGHKASETDRKSVV